MHFKSIEINEWQQFEHVHIEFHDRLTILTGANGSGKTTILDILSQHCNWIYIPLAIPKRVNGSEKMKFMPRFFDGMDKGSDTKIGCLVYSNDQQSKLNIYTESKVARYSITIHSQLPVDCFYITSHPSAFQYNEMHKMPAEGQDREEVFRLVYDAISDKYLGRSTEQPVFLMKEVLMSWEIEENGMGNNGSRISSSDQNEVRLLEGFQGVLRKVLPSSLGFKNIEIREMELVFVCNEGKDEFILESASGGISSLIELSWQIYTFSLQERGEFTVLIDEIENHLHPTMQRRVLYDLVNAFPQARFIVTTHSPLVVSSVKDSSVYALRYNDRNKIESHKLDLLNKAKTAQEILDEVLGVSFTMPIWVEEKLTQIVQQYAADNMDEAKFSQMRADLQEMGLERLMPTAIQSVVEQEPS